MKGMRRGSRKIVHKAAAIVVSCLMVFGTLPGVFADSPSAKSNGDGTYTIEGLSDVGGEVTLLVLKPEIELSDALDDDDIAYIDEVSGVKSVTFGMDNVQDGDTYKVYVGGEGVEHPASTSLTIASDPGNPGDSDGDTTSTDLINALATRIQAIHPYFDAGDLASVRTAKTDLENFMNDSTTEGIAKREVAWNTVLNDSTHLILTDAVVQRLGGGTDDTAKAAAKTRLKALISDALHIYYSDDLSTLQTDLNNFAQTHKSIISDLFGQDGNGHNLVTADLLYNLFLDMKTIATDPAGVLSTTYKSDLVGGTVDKVYGDLEGISKAIYDEVVKDSKYSTFKTIVETTLGWGSDPAGLIVGRLKALADAINTTDAKNVMMASGKAAARCKAEVSEVNADGTLVRNIDLATTPNTVVNKGAISLAVGATKYIKLKVAGIDITNMIGHTTDSVVATSNETTGNGVIKLTAGANAKSGDTATITLYRSAGGTQSTQDYIATLDVTITDQTEPEFKYGDVDGDGDITGGDAQLIRRHALGIIDHFEDQSGNEIPFAAGDVDGDGDITGGDAQLIRRHALGIISVFPVEEPLQ